MTEIMRDTKKSKLGNDRSLKQGKYQVKTQVVILGFRRRVNNIFSFLGYYVA
jgi:hypothetical protein